MSAITIDDDLVHYEVLGRGRPVILLHGWLGSWRYWVPVMQQLSMKYRTYAIDLWGFGDSGRDANRYDFNTQVALLEQFMERMGIAKAALIGHDLGAAVVAQFAAAHPDRVPRLMAVCPPLFFMAPKSQPLTANPAPALPSPATTPTGSPPPAPPGKPGVPVNPEAETMPWRTDEMRARIAASAEERAKELGEARLAEVLPKSPRDAAIPPTNQPSREIKTTDEKPTPPPPDPLPAVPPMPRADYVPESSIQQANPLKNYLETVDRFELLKRHVEVGPDQDKLRVEVEKTDPLAFSISVDAFTNVDTLRDLRGVSMPTVAVYGANDTFVPPPDDRMIATLNRPAFHALPLKDAHHFPMLENIAGFSRLLMDFLEAPDVTKLEIKDQWVRRVR